MSESIDMLWILVCSALVFTMQAGFLNLESGFTRTKNNINVAIKNISDFAISTLLFWAFGFALMFGVSYGGLFGHTDFLFEFDGTNLNRMAFFIFQVMFCGTAVTIVSGAISERVRYGMYLVIATIVAGLIYPILGHWIWNGTDSGTAGGWLNSMGFVDFAGSTLVHSIGGWVSLAVLLIVGARNGRFDENGKAHQIPPSNLTTATTGVMLLWFGWLGFNGGSALAFNATAIRAMLNTVMGGSAGLAGGLILSLILHRRADIGLVLNGTLAGLVGITANAHAVSLSSSVIIGMSAAVFAYGLERLLERLQIDDPVGAVPVHLAAGIWGTLAVGIFGDLSLLGTGLDRFQQIQVQVIGSIACAVWTFSTAYILVSIINRIYPIRVTPEGEYIGLNVSEHNAHNDMLDLFEAMDTQARTRDLNLRVPVEPFTEVGRIANRYNFVMANLQQAIERTNAIVRTASDAIITFTMENSLILSVNPAAIAMFGYDEASLQGKPVASLLEMGTQLPDVQELFADLQHSHQALEVLALRKNGASFPVELSVTRFEQGSNAYYTATFRDISMRKQMEKERQRVRDLELKTELATENSRLKSEFLSTMSHELRTPLNALIGYAGLLLMGVKGNIDQEAREVVTSVEESSRHLLILVNDILDIDKIEAGQFRLSNKPILAQRLVRSWLDHVRVLAERKGIELRASLADDFPIRVLGDQERLTQIVLNLLSNAIKFTDVGYVQLRVWCEGEVWFISVADTGIGIDEVHQALVFEKFRQVDGSYSRQYEGTGLGLAIVQQLARLMGGDVRLESMVGKGSTFTVHLPLVVPSA